MIISRTPFRMSFAGGGSDLREYYSHGFGSVVSTAINKYVFITVNRRFSDKIRVGYSKIEEVDTVDEIQHNLVREALKTVGIQKNIDVFYMSDLLPAHEGSGLGGSSSIIVGTLNALYAFKGEYVSADKLAEEACRIEIEVLKNPIGKQDQYAAAFGGFNHIRFNANESVFVNPVIFKQETLQKLRSKLLLFYLDMRKHSTDILTEQKANTANKLDVLGKMVDMSERLLVELRNGNIEAMGEMLHQGWLLKQTLASNISNPLIDEYYELARKSGAVGGKVLGSGGGGFLLLYADEAHHAGIRKSLAGLREADFNFEPEGSKIIYCH
jgi:D-glycero-alpha-D-manno-heptose-7-phosphate kinase